jgi:hypothetical protein
MIYIQRKKKGESIQLYLAIAASSIRAGLLSDRLLRSVVSLFTGTATHIQQEREREAASF